MSESRVRPLAEFGRDDVAVLNVTGETDVLDAVRYCYASLYTDRAISYRAQHGFDASGVLQHLVGGNVRARRVSWGSSVRETRPPWGSSVRETRPPWGSSVRETRPPWGSSVRETRPLVTARRSGRSSTSAGG